MYYTVSYTHLLLLAGAGAGFYYYYSKYINIDAIYPGVTIQGMSVGGMTQEEAEAKVQEYVDQVSQETVTLQVRKKETAFPLSDIGLKCTNMDVVEEAYNLGKTGNVFKRVMEVRELEKKEMCIRDREKGRELSSTSVDGKI